MARDTEAWEIVRAVSILFPTARLLGEGRFKVVFKLGDLRVIKVSKTYVGHRMEKETYSKLVDNNIPVAQTEFLSSRVQIQERCEHRHVPESDVEFLKEKCKAYDIVDIRPANIGWVRDQFVVMDWLPSGWKEKIS